LSGTQDTSDTGMTKKMSYEDVQRLIRETDQIRSQLNFLIQQLELINHSISDFEGSKKTLEEIQKREVGEQILLPLGSHLLIEAKLERKDSVLFDLGSNIIQEMDFETAKSKIQYRLDELNKSKSMLTSNITQLRSDIVARENFLNQLVPLRQ
jgi:prefoldin alpha subunit